MAAAPLLPLLSAVRTGLVHRWKALLCCVLVLSATLFLAQEFRLQRIAAYERGLLNQGAVNGDVTQLNLLLRRQEGGDASVDGEIRRIRERMSLRMAVMTGDRAPLSRYVRALPISFLLVGLITVLGYLACFAFVSILFIDTHIPADAAARWAARRLQPLALTVLLAFLCSMLWVPAIGIAMEHFSVGVLPFGFALVIAGYAVAIVLGPRLALAPTLLLLEHRDEAVLSLRHGIAASRGYWGKILGNMLACVIGVLLASGILRMIVHVVLPFAEAELLVRIVTALAATAFLAAFLVELTQTVVAHPEADDEEDGPVTGPEGARG
jgi:hypothetical protein